MKDCLVKEFQTRIVNAGRSELLIINYEMLLVQIDEAVEALDTQNDNQFARAMVNAQKMLRELSSSLDFKYEIAKELMSIYIYVNKKFIDASMKKERDALLEAQKLLEILLDGWKLVEFEDEAPVVSNAQKVYAGLTYGKESLNETVDSGAGHRGFKA